MIASAGMEKDLAIKIWVDGEGIEDGALSREEPMQC
jgi:hypothetical protein